MTHVLILLAIYWIVGVCVCILDWTRDLDMTLGPLMLAMLFGWMGWPLILIFHVIMSTSDGPVIFRRKR